MQPPGATWNRTDTSKHRKNSAKTWRASAIVGDPSRGVGILNNRIYKGQIVWAQSKWIRGAANSKKRRPEQLASDNWIVTTDESLRIVPDKLWEQVHAIQTETNARRQAIRKGIADGKRGERRKPRGAGSNSKYWLGTLLVCGECGSNYIGDGRRDYVCPAHTAGGCSNSMRFRREDAHNAMFKLLQDELLSPERIARGQREVEAALKERVKQEDTAANTGEIAAALKRLDEEALELRKMTLRPAVLTAGLAEIDKERVKVQARANGKRDQKASRARLLLARMPELAARYRQLVQQGIKALAKRELVDDAREQTRRLLVEGRITLAPNRTRTAVAGAVRLK